MRVRGGAGVTKSILFLREMACVYLKVNSRAMYERAEQRQHLGPSKPSPLVFGCAEAPGHTDTDEEAMSLAQQGQFIAYLH